MNIFYLSRSPYLAAAYHCDKHVVKMILETTQILSTVQHLLKGEYAPYKPTHENHPCIKWAANSKANYTWLVQLGLGLCQSYTNRYGKTHKCYPLLLTLLSLTPRKDSFPSEGFTDPPQCMPEQYKQSDTVEAYRAYYIGEKAAFAKWEKNNIYPSWWPEELRTKEPVVLTNEEPIYETGSVR